MTTTIRTRYATHPGSNVGDILATGAGRTHRRRIDQSQRLEDEHRAAANTLAARVTDAGAYTLELTDTRGVAGYVSTAGPNVWRVIPAAAVDLEKLAGRRWTATELAAPGQSAAVARRLIGEHGHTPSDRDRLTRENCGACVLTGYAVDAGDGPNYAGWARVYVQAGRPVPAAWRGAFRRELASDNLAYAGALARDILARGVRFTDGGAL